MTPLEGRPPLLRRRIIVHGRVHQVGFRASLHRRAVEADVAGWVCNRPDGTVEAVLEGAPEAVEALVEWSHLGPPLAKVVSVDTSEEQPTGERGFSFR